MRPSQYLIRLVVFIFIALDPSGGGIGVALGVATGVVIAVVAAGIKAFLKTRQKTEPVDAND